LFPENYSLISSPGIYRRMGWDHTTQQSKKIEFFIGPIIDELIKSDTSILLLDLDYTFIGNTLHLEERLSEEIPCIPVEFLLKQPKSSQTISNLKKLQESIQKMKNENMHDAFMYKGVSLWNYLKPIFDEIFFEPNLPTYLHLIDVATNFFKTHPPKVLIQVYESGPYAKSLQIAASKYNIRTIGVQHGLIPTDTPDYIFKELQSATLKEGNMIPDYTFVFGDYYKKILNEISVYPYDSVISTGHPSFFNLNEIQKSLDLEKILKKYDIKNKKIILFPLSFRFSYVENSPDKIILNELYKIFKNKPETIILVRPHPGDDFSQTILDKICPESNYICSTTSLFEDLTLCDIVIQSPISTVSSEAVIFEKPVFFVNVLEKNISENMDPVYHKLLEHYLVKLIDKKDIKSTISSFENNYLDDNLITQNDNFISDFFNLNQKPNFFKLLFSD